MIKIKKAIIPVAGLGTRFLPYTKAVPKEMLPILDIPAIHLIIEEALASGIDEILFVTSQGKESIENYFKRDFDLEMHLKKKKKHDILKELARVPYNFTRKSVIQTEAKGLGDAILHGEHFARGEYFAVFLPDDLIISKKPAMKQLIDAAKKNNKPVLAVERVAKNMVSSYGIIKPEKAGKRLYEVKDMAEKPKISEAFSNLGIVGRYVLPPSVFEFIRMTKPGAKGEIQLTDALRMVMAEEGMLACEFEGLRCDTGDKYEYILTVLKYAYHDKFLRKRIRKDVKKIMKL